MSIKEWVQSKIDATQRWIRNKKYVRDVYYEIAHDELNTGFLPIRLLKGPYSGTVYTYGKIQCGDDLGHKGMRASFDIDIIKAVGISSVNANNDPKFCKIAGDILLLLIEEAVQQVDQYSKNSHGVEDEEIGEDYFEEPLPQRTVREEDSSVSQKRISTRKDRKKPVRRGSKVCSPVQRDTDI